MRYLVFIDGTLYELSELNRFVRDNATEIVAVGEKPGETCVIKSDRTLKGPVDTANADRMAEAAMPPHQRTAYYGG